MSVEKAIVNILEGNLEEMRQNFSVALTEKASMKLDEKKVEIGQMYFGQMQEKVEQLDEAAVPDSHKKAMIKSYGPGRVTVDKKNGLIRHTDKYGETNSHKYDPNKNQPIGRHVGTISVDLEESTPADEGKEAARHDDRMREKHKEKYPDKELPARLTGKLAGKFVARQEKNRKG